MKQFAAWIAALAVFTGTVTLISACYLSGTTWTIPGAVASACGIGALFWICGIFAHYAVVGDWP